MIYRFEVLFLSPTEQVEEWSDWTPCNVTCGKGMKSRSRNATRKLTEKERGQFDLDVSAFCYRDPCENGLSSLKKITRQLAVGAYNETILAN